MTIQTTTRTRTRKSLLLGLGFGVALAGMVALGVPTRQADAAFTEKIVFASDRTTGTGVINPTGDFEIFRMNADGTGVRQLTTNKVGDFGPVLSPDKTKIAYHSSGDQTSNPEGEFDIYRMNALDGTAKKNLTHNGAGLSDGYAVFSPDGKTIAYESEGFQMSNPEVDKEIYRMNTLDGRGKKNLTNNGAGIDDSYPVFSPGGKRVAYQSYGKQMSNPEGEFEVYRMSALDGTGKKNLSNNGEDVDDDYPVFSADGTRIFYESEGFQMSNPEVDKEIYRMNTLDGTGKKNLTDNAAIDVVYYD